MRILAVSMLAIAAATLGLAPDAALARKKQLQPDPEYAPTLSEPPAPQPMANGAIFQPSNGYAPLTSGARAAMVGDLLTIALVERTQAVKSNGATTDRAGSIGLTPPATGPFSLFSPSDVASSGTNSFQGSGSAEQSNALQGEISVTIAAIYPNGTMLVRGEKLMRLNRGDEHIRFSGIVRQTDISPDNVVLSSRVADARITYAGTGEIARASKQGWLQRFFSIISPF